MTLRSIVWKEFRERPAAMIASLAAIALSVAVVSSCLVGEAPATGGDSVCGLSDCAGSAGASAADAGLALTLSIAVVVAETGSLGATSLG